MRDPTFRARNGSRYLHAVDEALVFRRADAATEPATALLAAAEAMLAEMYGPSGPLPRELLTPPAGGYLVVLQGDQPIAGGGFTRHDDETAEIRRMFVVPDARSRGVARRLLTALEDEIRSAGYRRVILDTGEKQPHAEALYRSAGYEEIENYRGPASRACYWGAKRLTSSD